MSKHPMQPIEMASDGVIRFKANAICKWLINTGRADLNEICRQEFSKEDQMQFAQLIGYSVSGYGDLSYSSIESVDEADAIAARLISAPATPDGAG